MRMGQLSRRLLWAHGSIGTNSKCVAGLITPVNESSSAKPAVFHPTDGTGGVGSSGPTRRWRFRIVLLTLRSQAPVVRRYVELLRVGVGHGSARWALQLT